MTQCLISLGSNVGDAGSFLQQAVAALRAEPQVTLQQISAWRETQPIGGPVGQANYVNAALTMQVTLSPYDLLDRLHDLERRLGRTRGARWQARTIDLDLLLYGSVLLDDPRLTLPHPRMTFRRFVLEPAVEVAADWRHPRLGWRLDKILEHLNSTVPYVALVGAEPQRVQALAAAAARGGRVQLVPDPVSAGELAAVPSTAREIEFLTRRGRQLLQVGQGRTPADDAFVISGFWWEQSLIVAAVAPTVDGASLQTAMQSLRDSVPPAKLLVVLISDSPDAAAFQHAMNDQLRQHPPAPLLFVDSRDLSGAIQEVTAAIAAMRRIAT